MVIVEKLKCFLRTNKYYKKYCQTSVNDCRYWCRGLKYYKSLYHWDLDKEIDGNTVFFIIDPAISHPGLADRMKAIIGTYYIAQQNGFDFKIIFEHPFHLKDYLASAHYASLDELSYSLKNSRVLAYNGGGRVPKLSRSVKQYHIYNYIGYDILETNQIGDYKKLWGNLYRQLFTPTPLLQDALNAIALDSNTYVAVHLRFVNALEQFEDNQFNFLSANDKEKLIKKCQQGIIEIQKRYSDKKIVVFSDSSVFLSRVKTDMPGILVLDGTVGHISFSTEGDVVLKTFVDFYEMGRASLVIRVLTKEIYPTVFSYYAALSDGKDCVDYTI